MTAIADASSAASRTAPARVHFDQPVDVRAVLIFLAILAGGLFFMAYSIYGDIADSGAAQKIAETLMSLFGQRRITLAMTCTGFIVGIPLFYNVGFVLLVPLVFSIVYQAKLPAVYVAAAPMGCIWLRSAPKLADAKAPPLMVAMVEVLSLAFEN